MTEFLKQPFLPNGKVELCCIAKGFDKIKKSLEQLSIKVMECEGCEEVDISIRNHPDINFFHLGGNKTVCAKNNGKLINTLSNEGFEIIKSQNDIKSPYPYDVSLNVMILDNILWSGKTADEFIKEYAKKQNMTKILLNQGYVKCTTCVVNNHSVITSDLGTAKIFKNQGLDVLLIEQGGIELPGYDYGFLGGSCGLIDKKTLAFTGDISRHKDWKKIKAFLTEREIKYISLTEERLIDIGSVIPLTENQV